MSGRYIDPEAPGYEESNTTQKRTRERVKNLYCPYDGHYCEQPNCDNCNFEKKIH